MTGGGLASPAWSTQPDVQGPTAERDPEAEGARCPGSGTLESWADRDLGNFQSLSDTQLPCWYLHIPPTQRVM